ncbi:PAS domain-containing protein [Daejeonella oryzae]|uniref:PAS domain-containing protein n=1 Tax=Daejeonella oryzae TaxID=1122943 RepID=UPI00041C915C|nr:PAS domain-containing protein [Daejeonella oryzae]
MTETKKADQDALINNTDNLMWYIDIKYQLLSANRSYKYYLMRKLGLAVSIGDCVFYEDLGDEINSRWKNFYDDAFAGKKHTITLEYDKTDTGESKQAEVSFNPISNGSNEIIGVGCFAHDITQRVNFEEKIIAQNQTLKKIASLASHDIRGPVASMLGLLSLFDKSKIKDSYNLEIVNYLEECMQDLDQAIHKIVEITYSLDPDVNTIKNSFPRNLSENESP